MGIEQTSVASEVWGDLYGVFRALFDDPRLPARRVYFDGIEGDNFERPSYQIKFITLRNRPGNFVHKTMAQDIMVKYFAETEFEAIAAAEVIMDILSGWPIKTLPKYDFSVSPPRKISYTGRDQYGRVVSWAVGNTIESDSIKADPFQTEDDRWEVPVTFTMLSPRIRNINPTTVTAITYDLLVGALTAPEELVVVTQASASVELL